MGLRGMRRIGVATSWPLLALVLALGSPAAPARAGSSAAAPAVQPLPYQQQVQAYLRGRPVSVTVAVRSLGEATTTAYAPEVSNVTASIVKLAVMAAVLHRAQQQGRAPTSWERAQLVPMITVSDNDATTRLWNDLGGGAAVAAFLALVPLPSTRMAAGGSWGLTTTTAADQVALLQVYAEHNALLDDASRAYGLQLMHSVRSDQAWGVSAGPPAGSVAVKNGWLPRTDGWHVNSDGIVLAGRTRYLVSILSSSRTASMAELVATIEGVSRIVWAAQSAAAAGTGTQLYATELQGTGSGRVEVRTLSAASQFSTAGPRVATALPALPDPDRWTALYRPFTGPRRADLVLVHSAGTASGRVEVHALTAASGYRTWAGHLATALPAARDGQWQFQVAPYAGDHAPDLYAIRTTGTASGHVEVVILAARGGYQRVMLRTATPLSTSTVSSGASFLVDSSSGDIVVVDPAVGSGLHWRLRRLTSSSGYRQLGRQTLLPLTSAPGPAVQFSLADQTGDGAADLAVVLLQGTSSGTTELHVLDGASGFTRWALHSRTGLPLLPGRWRTELAK